MRQDHLKIAEPCHESWEAMDGAGARRFCGACQKHVHDLSAMAQDEAAALLRARAGESLCVRYTSEHDGTLRFRDLVPRAALTRKIVRTAFAGAMLAACTPHEGPATVQDLGASFLESIRERTVPTADGGCDYTTGPFTTFHLSAGHVLCAEVTVAPPPLVTLGSIGDGEEEPPPDVDPEGERRWPSDEVPWVDPAAVPTMGQAVANPEPTQPLVPCDPRPGFAAPPDAKPVADEPQPIKGRMKVRPPPPEKPRKTMGAMVPSDDPLK